MDKHPLPNELSVRQMKGFAAAVARTLPLPTAEVAQFWIDNPKMLQQRLKTLQFRPVNMYWTNFETASWTFKKLVKEGLVRILLPSLNWYYRREPKNPYDHIDLVIVDCSSEDKFMVAETALKMGAKLIVICSPEDHALIFDQLGRHPNINFWVENLDRFEWFLREQIIGIQENIS